MPRVFLPLLLLFLIAAPARAAEDPPAPFVQPALSWRQAQLFADVLAKLRAEYVDPVDDSVLIDLALRGMLAGLDPHSAYLAPGEYKELDDLTHGTYDGVGLDLVAEPEGLRVVAPLPGSPAARAGLARGDVVTAIDGKPVATLEPSDALGLLRGTIGSVVEISVRHEGEDTSIPITLKRERVKVSSVVASVLEPGFLHLRVSQFSGTTARDLAKALAALTKDGPPRGAVLDLRGNGGGIFESAVEVADLFLEDGLIVTSEGRASDASFVRRANAGDALSGAPLVVLVDAATASAAEIVAGALKDRHRGVVIGSATFGKGSVQTVLPLTQGGALKFTSARWRMPSGEAIPLTGIEPDIPLSALPPSLGGATGLAQQDPALAQALLAVKAAKFARAN
jgi:carboxyl-terminal processing protease